MDARTREAVRGTILVFWEMLFLPFGKGNAMERVLLTGATGFIGRHCVSELLMAGYEVHAVSSAARHSLSDVTWHQCDLLNGRQTEALLGQIRPSHLLHTAWYVAPGKFWSAPENLLWVQASLTLMLAFQAVGGQGWPKAGDAGDGRRICRVGGAMQRAVYAFGAGIAIWREQERSSLHARSILSPNAPFLRLGACIHSLRARRGAASTRAPCHKFAPRWRAGKVQRRHAASRFCLCRRCRQRNRPFAQERTAGAGEYRVWHPCISSRCGHHDWENSATPRLDSTRSDSDEILRGACLCCCH
jgi:hypothetical protein